VLIKELSDSENRRKRINNLENFKDFLKMKKDKEKKERSQADLIDELYKLRIYYNRNAFMLHGLNYISGVTFLM